MLEAAMLKGSSLDLKGWIELGGNRLSEDELESILSVDPLMASKFGGEFILKWGDYKARDHFGIMVERTAPVDWRSDGAGEPDIPPGTVICCGREIARVDPGNPLMDLDEAVQTAVGLRSDEGVVAMSGGVDSALVARLANRECVVVGLSGSHDLRRAKEVAAMLSLPLESAVIDPEKIEEALGRVLGVIPRTDPVNASIATTLYFVAEWAGNHGYTRILAGQGADELFGGYARYLHTDTLGQDMERDFQNLSIQLRRDQAVSGLYGAYFSLPYMDTRVVRAARAVPPELRVVSGVRKLPLREVAKRHLPQSIAMYEKKAMQYGSGMMREIERLARRRGFKNDLQGYLEKVLKANGLADGAADRSKSNGAN